MTFGIIALVKHFIQADGSHLKQSDREGAARERNIRITIGHAVVACSPYSELPMEVQQTISEATFNRLVESRRKV